MCFVFTLPIKYLFLNFRMKSQRASILALHRQGKRQAEIVRLLGVPKQTVSYAVNRFKELGHDGDRLGRGRKRTVNTSRNRKIIKKRVIRNPHVSMRKIARQTGIARESVRMIAKKELNLHPYKLKQGQMLTDDNKRIRLERCRELLKRAATPNWERILFSDEKLFSVEQSYNGQNDRIWSTSSPGNASIVQHRQNPKSVMVWAGICATGKTPLVFIDSGVKINKDVYRKDILEDVVLPWAQQHFGNQLWTFQQDSAPSHRAKTTQDWCKANFPDFISAQEWPPYSCDLNPLDYSVWSILESRACAKPHKSLEALKRSLRREWDKITVAELRPIAENFTKRLKLCVKAKGGHFEN